MDNRYQIGFRGKRYGLIMPSKGPAAARAPAGGAKAAGKAASIFAAAAQEEDHEADDQGRGAVNRVALAESARRLAAVRCLSPRRGRRDVADPPPQAKKAHREAETMDASIFDYDSWKEKDARTQERQEVRRVAANATKAKVRFLPALARPPRMCRPADPACGGSFQCGSLQSTWRRSRRRQRRARGNRTAFMSGAWPASLRAPVRPTPAADLCAQAGAEGEGEGRPHVRGQGEVHDGCVRALRFHGSGAGRGALAVSINAPVLLPPPPWPRYKRKLEEDKRAEEEERRKEAEDAAGGMKGFFTNLIEAQTGHDADRRTLGGVAPPAAAPAPGRPRGEGDAPPPGAQPSASRAESGLAGEEPPAGAGTSARKRQRGGSPQEQSPARPTPEAGQSAPAAQAAAIERGGGTGDAAPGPAAGEGGEEGTAEGGKAGVARAPPGVTVAPPAAESDIEAARRRAMERMKRRRKQ